MENTYTLTRILLLKMEVLSAEAVLYWQKAHLASYRICTDMCSLRDTMADFERLPVMKDPRAVADEILSNPNPRKADVAYLIQDLDRLAAGYVDCILRHWGSLLQAMSENDEMGASLALEAKKEVVAFVDKVLDVRDQIQIASAEVSRIQ